MAAKFEEGEKGKAPRERSPAEARLKSASSGDTLPPTPLRDLLTAGGANVFVLSADPELVETVQRAAGEHYPVFVVAHWAELDTEIRSGRCGIALLDGDLLGAELARRIGELDAHSDRVVVLVAAQRSRAEGLMAFLSERKIHRLLIKPSAQGITRLLIESAVKRCLQLRERSGGGVELDDRRFPPPRRAKRVPAWVFTAAGLALLAGVGLVIGLSSWWRAPPPAAGADDGRSATQGAVAVAAPSAEPPLLEAAPEAPAAAESRFAELLSRAEQAFREGRLTAPAGDNALDYYLTILAADPSEPTARREITVVVDALFSQAESALLAGQIDAAAEALANVRRADPSSGRLQFLEAQLERARSEPARPPAPAAGEPAGDERVAAASDERVAAAADDAAAAVRAELAANLVAAARRAINAGDLDAAAPLAAEARRIGADGAELARLDTELARARAARAALRRAEWLAAAQQRLRDNALVTPEADSARHYLAQLQAEAPTFPGLDAAWADWRTAVSRAAQQDLAARRWDAVGAWMAALEDAPGGAALAASLGEELDFGRRQERYLATAVPAGEFTLLEGVAPVYPEAAERRGQEGWVELEFTIDATGNVRDVIVAEADPPARFDEAAVAAVSRYRFAPFEEDGRRYARRARVRVRFTIE